LVPVAHDRRAGDVRLGVLLESFGDALDVISSSGDVQETSGLLKSSTVVLSFEEVLLGNDVEGGVERNNVQRESGEREKEPREPTDISNRPRA